MSVVLKLTCQRCGNNFAYERKSLRGKLPVYCDNCKHDLILESKQKYRDKTSNKESNLKIIDTNKYKADNDYMGYVNRTLELLGQLDTLRVNMCNLASELGEYQSSYDKQDQEFIHQIELNNFTTGAEALKFVNDWHQDRASRRNVKNLIKLLGDVLKVIPVKNKFTAINNIQNIKLKEK